MIFDKEMSYMKTLIKIYTLTFAAILLIGCATFTIPSGLKTEEMQDKKISGIFTLLLYGNRFGGDIETITIFDKEGDQYTFDIFAPDFDYRVIKGLSADEAMEVAEGFVSMNINFKRSQMSKIFDPNGNVIGYELRPLYFTVAYGSDDVLDVDYRIKGDKVIVKIQISPFLQQKRFFNKDSFDKSD